jgi:hypothetical protein
MSTTGSSLDVSLRPRGQLPTLNAKVWDFCAGHVGLKVGSGQCSDLASKALRAAGAWTTDDYHISGVRDDYVWGNLVASAGLVIPGDVIQYRSGSQVTFSYNGGNWTANIGEPPNIGHSAVVAYCYGQAMFDVFQQKMGGVMKVKVQRVGFGHFTRGGCRFYLLHKHQVEIIPIRH